MTVTGIIAEFNPFHNGHKYLLDQAEGVKIVAMSGNFVQRGEPAIVDKWIRAQMALENGADEIDMVINLGWLKEGKYDAVEEEIRCLKKVCGEKILKVIIETCLLTEQEKIKMCEIVTRAGADYIKTSTGFSKAGASFEDIRLFSEHIGPGVKMKAAGGISSLEDAEKFLSLGADRLGTSRIVKLIRQEEATGY